MSFFSSLLGGGKAQASQQAAAAGVNVQTSVAGKPITLIYGTTRIAPNFIWYGDFNAVQQKSSSGSAGKGGVGGGGGGKGGGGNGNYQYYASFIGALCEGQISHIGNVWVDKNITSLSSLGMTFFAGQFAQSPWGYMETSHADQALGYSYTAYIAAANYSLGSSPQLPNHNFEVYGDTSYTVGTNGLDADPSMVVADLLSNAVHGAGFPSARIGDLSIYKAYCIASGFWISPFYDSQTQANSILQDIAQATNSEFVWSQGVLTLVPYGDQGITARGYTYNAPSAPVYALTDDDFQPNQASAGSGNGSNTYDPVQLIRKRPSDAFNSIILEYLDRTNSYATNTVQATDQAMINTFGIRQDGVRSFHMFCDGNAAQLSCTLQLYRQQIRNQYSFTLDQRFVGLDPMDIVSISDSYLGLSSQWVRILSITENEDLTLSFLAEEYLAGTGNAPLYSLQANNGFEANYNESPGNANIPVLFEPVAQYEEALEVIIGASGGSLWGGCDVWISSDGDTYKNAGRITGNNRQGVLSAVLPAVTEAQTGQTIDQINTLSVDLSESNASLASASLADAGSLASLCYVDGELIAYQNAVLTAANQYSLTWLVRGCYGSPISTHAAGSQFLRLDNNLLTYSFTPEYIGKTIYIKLVSFNIYGGGEQAIADIQPYAYTIQGTAYSSPLPDIANLRSSYVAGITQLAWDEISDFRPVQYEIRKGTTPTGAQILGRIAHPPFNVQGNDTYWVAAYSQPVAGLQVYSSGWEEITISGSAITSNVIASYDEAATGWSGTFGGSAVFNGAVVQTSATGNILTDADYLDTLDILNYGANIGNGTYEIPAGHEITIGRVAPCQILISWASYGQKITDNILIVADYLNDNDILDAAASLNTNVYPEIALSQDGTTWGAWQKYSPGSYSAMKFKSRMQLQTYDPQTIAYLGSFVFGVDVPDRDDHYINVAIASGGTTLTWTPDGAASPAPFNGGNGGASVPAVQVTVLNAMQGDTVVLSSVSLSSGTVKILNGGTGVARNVNVLAQGY